MKSSLLFLAAASLPLGFALDYPIVDTNQEKFYGVTNELPSAPASESDPFYGQDAQFTINPSSYVDNGDGTVLDLNTGLMWTQDYWERDTLANLQATASTVTVGGYSDWRLPTNKELYSLMDFRGTDATDATDTTNLIPFIDTNYFNIRFGGDGTYRIIDVQYATTTNYLCEASVNLPDWFGVNFVDGRTKGYSSTPPNFFARYVRGQNTNYGVNSFSVSAGGTTVSDANTGLMWEQADSGTGMDWQAALLHCVDRTTGGYTDWRLPNAKELHSIIDYTRCPDQTNSAAIDSVFQATGITNEAGNPDWAYYWTSTTHKSFKDPAGTYAVYFSFGRAMGNYTNVWQDVHGSGSQKSDPKAGDPTSDQYVYGFGPQGDAIRINNFVRCVRTETSGTYPTTRLPTPSPALRPTPQPTPQPTPSPTDAPTSAPTSGCIFSVPGCLRGFASYLFGS